MNFARTGKRYSFNLYLEPELTKEPGVLQSAPKRKGSNAAEKVTGGAIVEPTTPDVAVPAKQAQHITRSWNRIPAICQRFASLAPRFWCEPSKTQEQTAELASGLK